MVLTYILLTAAGIAYGVYLMTMISKLYDGEFYAECINKKEMIFYFLVPYSYWIVNFVEQFKRL